MNKSKKLLDEFIKNRLSKIDYKLTSSNVQIDKNRLFFNQGCQTDVGTDTFIKILETYNAWLA